MARISAAQNTAMCLLDLIFFNQILVHSVYEKEHRKILYTIVEAINKRTELELPVDAELIKHYCLCYLEIMMADSDYHSKRVTFLEKDHYQDLAKLRENDIDENIYIKISELNKTWFSANLLVFARRSISEDLADKAFVIAESLKDHCLTYPAVIRYRLAERCFAAEYPDAALDFYAWCVKSGLFKTKHKNIDLEESFSCLRAVMLFNYQCLRNSVAAAMQTTPSIHGGGKPLNMAKVIRNVGDVEKDFIEIPYVREEFIAGERQFEDLIDSCLVLEFLPKCFSDSEYISNHFRDAAEVFQHIKFCRYDVRRWRSIIAGAWVLKEESFKKKPKFTHGNDQTLTFESALRLKRKGFGGSHEGKVNPRTIQNQYKEIKQSCMPFVNMYYMMIKSMGIVYPAETKDFYYYNTLRLLSKL